MNIVKRLVIAFLKGAFIGIGTVIPGVSGGTAAIITGEFETILDAAGNFHKHIKKSIFTLLPILSGAFISIYIVSRPITLFCEYYPTASKYTFCILSIISTLIFVNKNIELNIKRNKILCFIIGFTIALIISFSIRFYQIYDTEYDIISLLMIGFILALALVLPAISFSYMLLFFGLYEKTLYSLSSFDFTFIIPLGLGIASGALIFSKLFLKLIEKYTQETYCFVFGFVICSIVDILL